MFDVFEVDSRPEPCTFDRFGVYGVAAPMQRLQSPDGLPSTHTPYPRACAFVAAALRGSRARLSDFSA